MTYYPKIRITVPRAETIFTTVEMNGLRLPVTRVRFDTGETVNGQVLVELTLYADIEVEAGLGVVTFAAPSSEGEKP